MDIQTIINFIANLDHHLLSMVGQLGDWTYLLFFTILFAETGMIIFSFLPGESLIFFASSLAALTQSSLDIRWLAITFFAGAVIGDMLNFHIGRWLAQSRWLQRWLTPKRLAPAQRFFTRHGRKAVIFARFVPVARALTPLVAGSAGMPAQLFYLYNVLGVGLWVAVTSALGYYCGRLPLIRDHFSLIFVAIGLLALLPVLIHLAIRLVKKTKHQRV